MPHVVLLTGLPASGKLTVATELVRQMEERGLPTRLVDNHYVNNVIFRLLDPDGETPLPKDVWDRVGEVSAAVVGTIEEHSPAAWSFVFTVYISGLDDEWFVDRIGELAERRGSRYTVVELICDVDELARRIAAPERAERYKMTSVSGIRELHERGTPLLDRSDVIRIDTTNTSPEAAAGEILARMGFAG